MKFKEEKLCMCIFFKELDTFYISHTLHLYFFYATKILLRLQSNSGEFSGVKMRNKDAESIWISNEKPSHNF
jgi:hypothetical protein